MGNIINGDIFILLAEDDADMSELLQKSFMKIAPYLRIKAVSDGEEAARFLLDCPTTQLPSLILLDYNMPLMNAAEVLKKIKYFTRYVDVPKLVYSTYLTPGVEQVCYKEGMTEYLMKPMDIAEVPDLVKKVLSFLPAQQV